MIQRLTLSFGRSLPLLKYCSPVIPQYSHFSQMNIRYFAKKQKKGADAKRERKEKLKQEAAEELKDVDADNFANEAKAAFDTILANFKADLKKIQVGKTSPKTIAQLLVKTEKVQQPLKDIAEITNRADDTITVIPRDPMYLRPIIDVSTKANGRCLIIKKWI